LHKNANVVNQETSQEIIESQQLTKNTTVQPENNIEKLKTDANVECDISKNQTKLKWRNYLYIYYSFRQKRFKRERY
jgi:hypothetical protein